MPLVGYIAIGLIAGLFALGIWNDFIRPRK
jgi:hypothetical protein